MKKFKKPDFKQVVWRSEVDDSVLTYGGSLRLLFLSIVGIWSTMYWVYKGFCKLIDWIFEKYEEHQMKKLNKEKEES